MNRNLTIVVKYGILSILLLACQNSEIKTINLKSIEIESFIEKFAIERNTNLVLMQITNGNDSTEILLYDLYSTCLLDIGDDFGFLVDKKWRNITAPMFKTQINSVDVYIETGIEKINKSRKRYERLLFELKDRIDICVESYNQKEDSFSANPSKTSLQMPWKFVINNDRTHMNTYISRREGYDDFYYEIEKVRIDTNYQEKYD